MEVETDNLNGTTAHRQYSTERIPVDSKLPRRDLDRTESSKESPMSDNFSNAQNIGSTKTHLCKDHSIGQDEIECKQQSCSPTENTADRITEFREDNTPNSTSRTGHTMKLKSRLTGYFLTHQKDIKSCGFTDSEYRNDKISQNLPITTCKTKTAASLGEGESPASLAIGDDKTSNKESVGMDHNARHPSRREYVLILYSACVTLPLSLSYGNANPFSSPLLEDINRPRPNSTTFSAISGNESCVYQNLIGPSAMIGGAIGAMLTFIGWLIIGSVNTMIAAAMLSALGWLMIGISWFVLSFPSLLQLFWGLMILGRIVTGIGMGLASGMSIAYYGGIAHNERHRTLFLVFQYTFYAIGVIETYMLGSFLPYWICAFIYAGQQALILPFLPFITQPQQEKHSTVWTRIINLKTSIHVKISDALHFNKTIAYQFSTRMMLSIVLMCMHVYMGYTVILMYVGPILQVAGADHWTVPHGVLVALTIGGSDLVGSILSLWVTTRIGRILACVIGAAGICVGHLGLMLYFVLVEGLVPRNDYSNTTSGWMNSSTHQVCFFEPSLNADLGEQYSPLAMLSLALVMLSYGIFWMSQPYIIMVEIFPDQWRPLGTGLSVGLIYINDTILTAIFPLFEKDIGIAGCFLILAIISGMAVFIIPALIPETKGHPMGERGGEFTPRRNLIEFGLYLKSFLPSVTWSRAELE